jgi:hypothetical protein
MKAIINGKRYDTETATCVAGDSGGQGKRDFRWYDEDLYLTKKGNWFLAGEGGPMSRWAEPGAGQNEVTSGEGIVPLTKQEAREWLERAEKWDCIEKYFGNAVQDA